MGGPGASLAVDDSVGNMIAVIDGLTAKDNGRYYNWDGAQQTW